MVSKMGKDRRCSSKTCGQGAVPETIPDRVMYRQKAAIK